MAQPFNPFAPTLANSDAAYGNQGDFAVPSSSGQSPFAPVAVPPVPVAATVSIATPPAGSSSVASPATLHETDLGNSSLQAPTPQPLYHHPPPAGSNPDPPFAAWNASPVPAVPALPPGSTSVSCGRHHLTLANLPILSHHRFCYLLVQFCEWLRIDLL